jgi:hypothetical protein
MIDLAVKMISSVGARVILGSPFSFSIIIFAFAGLDILGALGRLCSGFSTSGHFLGWFWLWLPVPLVLCLLAPGTGINHNE